MKTPLQQNFVHGPESDDEENVIGDDMPVFITEDEEYSKNSAVERDENFILENFREVLKKEKQRLDSTAE